MNAILNNEHVETFPPGYGQFPYIILKAHYAVYMQIPIHFFAEGETEYDINTYPGSHLKDVPEEVLNLSRKQQIEILHNRLLELTQLIIKKIEEKGHKNIRICLVEGLNKAYYFEHNSIKKSKSIPLGGTLITQENKILSMGLPHFKENTQNTGL